MRWADRVSHLKKCLHKSAYITLIHGTFARDAPWMQNGNPFKVRLRDALGTRKCTIDCFNWSGDNNHAARLQAATELAEFLELRLQQFSDCKHFAIAHSHGGNVLLSALQEVTGITGIITLGTPFISASRRDLLRIAHLVRWIVPFAVPAFLLASWILYYSEIGSTVAAGFSGIVRQQSIFEQFYLAHTDSITWPTSVVVIALGILFLIYERWALPGVARRSQERVDRTLNIYLDPVPPLLCGMANDDEAGRWLSLIRLIRDVPNVVLNKLGVLLTFFAGALTILFGAIWISPSLQSSDRLFWTTVYSLETLASTLFLLITGLAVIPWLIRAHRLGFGGERLSDNIYCEIVTSATPLGWLCEAINISRHDDRIPDLHHSSFLWILTSHPNLRIGLGHIPNSW